MIFKTLLSLILGLVCLCWASFAQAQQGSPQNAGARGAAMGNASVTFTDINSAFSNQAGLAFLEELSFTAYGESRFLTTGINSFLFGVAYPHKKLGTFGLTVNYFGFDAYSEQKIGISYARKLFKNLSLGVQLDYLGTRIPEYGSANSLTFELGLLAKVNDELSIGVHAYSPVRVPVHLGANGNFDKISPIFKIGAAYTPSKHVILSGEIEKNLDHPFNGKLGIEYRPIDVFAIRAGVSTSPFLASFGFGLRLKSLDIDLASSYHQMLGFTPSLSVSYAVGRAGKESHKQD
ncbi:MAG: hypothetical protein MK212_20010 [Saprospiraceae bacterium]|nr:hypothetical protein [Saprospiraceae bacterium]